MFDDDNLEELVGDVRRIVGEGASILGESAESIAAVTQSSAEYVAQRLASIDYWNVRTAICDCP